MKVTPDINSRPEDIQLDSFLSFYCLKKYWFYLTFFNLDLQAEFL